MELTCAAEEVPVLGRTLRVLAAAGLGLGTAVVLAGPVAAGATSGSVVTSSATTTLRVGSFNLSSVAFDPEARGAHRRWLVRRPVVVAQILAERLDVVGLQEADQSSVYRRSLSLGANQFLDLRNALNRAGGHYAVTNRFAYNCVRSTSSRHCRHRDRGAAQDDRILYDTRALRLVRQGSVRYRRQTPHTNPRYLAWGVLASRATGRRLLFTDTHLDPYRVPVRRAQWSELITRVDRLAGGLPVVAVGDFNTSKFDPWARRFLPAMVRHGYGDVVGQTYRQSLVEHPRAESTHQAWLNSFNGWRRAFDAYAYDEEPERSGNAIDWIFASNRLRVQDWRVVAHLDLRTGRVVGVLPSDHFLVTATLVLA